MPGPESSTTSRTRLPSTPTLTATTPAGGAYLNALSSRTPSRRSSHSDEPITTSGSEPDRHLERGPAALGDRRESLRRLVDHHADLDRLGGGTPLRRVHPREPEQVVDKTPDPPALRAHPLERIAIPGGVAILAQGEARLGLDDGKRSAELVRGVGCELQLALAGELDRGADPATHDQGAEEHQQQHPESSDRLGDDQRRPRLRDRVDVEADDQLGRTKPVIYRRTDDPHVHAFDLGVVGSVTHRVGCRKLRLIADGGDRGSVIWHAAGGKTTQTSGGELRAHPAQCRPRPLAA